MSMLQRLVARFVAIIFHVMDTENWQAELNILKINFIVRDLKFLCLYNVCTGSFVYVYFCQTRLLPSAFNGCFLNASDPRFRFNRAQGNYCCSFVCITTRLFNNKCAVPSVLKGPPVDNRQLLL